MVFYRGLRFNPILVGSHIVKNTLFLLDFPHFSQCWGLILDDRLKFFNRCHLFLIMRDNTNPLCHPWSSNPVKILILGHPVSSEDIRLVGITLMVPDFIPGILVDGSIGWWPENENPSNHRVSNLVMDVRLKWVESIGIPENWPPGIFRFWKKNQIAST